MSAVQLYTKNTKVWIPNPATVWQSAELCENFQPSTKKLQIITDDDHVHKTLDINGEQDLPPLRNPAILIGQNDLTCLSYLHEPAVLYNLQVRFTQQRSIYTYCGIVLVAINPYDDLHIYTPHIMRAYRGQSMGDLDPHVFAVAEEAYTRLEREKRNQSVIVSGESGAGKTVSAKFCMRYFATVSGTSGGDSMETHVEKKVLASSPIMEAIGNAKTTRNDNSSRFGKFIEIHFDKSYHIVGASMRTYLLEKSRVVFQADGERNYHIFYQLCAVRQLYPELKLTHQDNFQYLNRGANPEIDGVDDFKTFHETLNAFNVLGFSDKEQRGMFRVIAGILHLGNVAFTDVDLSGDHSLKDSEGSSIRENDESLRTLCTLLEINHEQMRQWLCTRKIRSSHETFLKPMTITQAIVSRDALAKHIYSKLFDWIVRTLNKALESSTKSRTPLPFIGVLDIYGFETFETNSFEQFCINYANEKLQQQFNQHVFKLEQEEYIREGIAWTMIDFYDNQPCIDLIEAKLGVLDLLDEECKMPKGTNLTWIEKLNAKCSTSKYYAKARFGASAFVVRHFADNVTYESLGFLEKNRDTVVEEQIDVLRNSNNSLVKRLFAAETPSDGKLKVPAGSVGNRVKISASKPSISDSSKAYKKTVGSQFRDSLNQLMATLNDTTPHYVRCIKPNDEKAPFEFNPTRAVQQLRACGVLETIRLSAAGFPGRWYYEDFFMRYRLLCHSKSIRRADLRASCEAILRATISCDDKYQFGKEKIFFRAGQVAYLEKLRSKRLHAYCVIVQSQIRAFIARRKYLRVKRAIENVQRYARGYLARIRAQELRRNRSAIIVQKNMRRFVRRVQYLRLRSCILGIQKYSRGYLARKRYAEKKYNAKAIIIQKHVRGWLARKGKRERLRKIVVCQSAIRRFLARRRYKKLRIEARSIEHVKNLNKGLENKIISLQQRIEEMNKDNHALKLIMKENAELKTKLENSRALENTVKQLKCTIVEKDNQFHKLIDELNAERDEKMDLIAQQEKYKVEIDQMRDEWSRENCQLKEQVASLTEKLTAHAIDETLQARVEEEKRFLMEEHEQERQEHQNLLRYCNDLEQRYDDVVKKLNYHIRASSLASSATNSLQRNSHMRNFSDLSMLSIPGDDLSNLSNVEINELDFGYGSVRSQSTATTERRLENIDWDRDVPTNSSPKRQPDDLPLHIRQQKLIEYLQTKLERYENESLNTPTDTRTLDSIRASELEIDNDRLKRSVEKLFTGVATKDAMRHIEALEEELQRRREECIQLRSVLASQSTFSAYANERYASVGVNDDPELAQAYEAQKKINLQLENELQLEKQRNHADVDELKAEIDALTQENNRLSAIVAENLNRTPGEANEAYLQSELQRVLAANVQLAERYEKLQEMVKRLLSGQISRETGADHVGDGDGRGDNNNRKLSDERRLSGLMQDELPLVRKKAREYQGMFEFRQEDIPLLIENLVQNLKPRLAVRLLPGLPAYILFMCVRHTDFVNDDHKLKSLLQNFIVTVKQILKKHHNKLETIVLWLANTLRLLHCLKQYSGEAAFQYDNSEKQKRQSLKNFDLTEYRQVLSDIAVMAYQTLINILEEKIQPIIIPAILEHEAIQTLGGLGSRPRLGSKADASVVISKAPQALTNELSNFYKLFEFYGVDADVTMQVFRQLFFFICATSLNNLLLRKEFCNWSKGCQIRYNLSYLTTWASEKSLANKISDTLEPIVQASLLLQARKTIENVESVCDMCRQLTPEQICTILQHYTPIDESERVSSEFIQLVKDSFKSKHKDKNLLLETREIFPVRFSFNPSDICLENVDIPQELNLPMLRKC